MNNEFHTKNLRITPLSPEQLEAFSQTTHPFFEKQRLKQALDCCKNDPENSLWYTIWQITEINDDEAVIGQLQFTRLPTAGRVEVNCALAPVKDSEKLAAEALKSMAKWAFSNKKELKYVSTWLLDDDSPASKILENAGFTQTFESDGMVHYELARPRLPLLAIVMCGFVLISFIPGFLLNDYPLWVTVGIFAGILPGHLIENAVTRFRERKGATLPQK